MRRLLREPLAGRGWSVVTAASFAPALIVAGGVLVFDISDQADPEQICQQWRDGAGGAMLLLVSDPDLFSRGQGWGAEAILPLPVRLSALIVRLDQIRQQQQETRLLRCGPVHLDPPTRMLCHDNGTSIRLTEKEVALLQHLLAMPERRADRETVLQQVWGYGPDLSTHTVETYLYRLRKKITAVAGQAVTLRVQQGAIILTTEDAAPASGS